MIKHLCEAISIWWKNIWIVFAIVLTVWIPGRVVLSLIFANSPASGFSLSAWLVIALLKPLSAGVLIFAIDRFRNGESVTYIQAMTAGIKRWGVLFFARLRANITIGIGCFFLLVPGLVFLARFSFIESAVMVEGNSGSSSIDRSIHLTEDLGWQILKVYMLRGAAWVACFLPILFMSKDSSMYLQAQVALNCFIEVLLSVFTIVLYLYFCEAIDTERTQENVRESLFEPAMVSWLFRTLDFKQTQ